MSATVKIMRSYDYCHFEICIGSEETYSDSEIDDMRKIAMRLVDKAVEQYKIARKVESRMSNFMTGLPDLQRAVQVIKENYPASEWTAEQQAKVKALQDLEFQLSRRYDYEDDYDLDAV